MKDRGQLLVALLILVGVVAAGLYVDRQVGAAPLAEATPPGVPSAAWYCPHGGGDAWDVRLGLANPGTEPVLARVRSIGDGKPGVPEDHVVPPGSTIVVPVPGDGRERSAAIEYFGGFVAAGWLSLAGEDANGVAAEPCLAAASDRWLVPDGSGLEGFDDWVVVMNPFATDAVVSLTALSERRDPVRIESWTNVTLKPYHARAFRLNVAALGETTIGTVVDASVGRVVAATLGIGKDGGIRSTDGLPGGASVQVLPGAADAGRTDLAVTSAGVDRVQLSGTILEGEAPQPLPALADAAPAGESARTIPFTTADPSTLVVRAEGDDVVFARRTYGVASDQGSTIGATEAGEAWVLLPSVVGQPSHPAIALANPGDEPATVTLSVLAVDGGDGPAPSTVEVPPGSTVPAPKGFAAGAATSSVLVLASSGTVVPVSASYALGREGYATYAVAAGVRIPDAWVSSIRGSV